MKEDYVKSIKQQIEICMYVYTHIFDKNITLHTDTNKKTVN